MRTLLWIAGLFAVCALALAAPGKAQVSTSTTGGQTWNGQTWDQGFPLATGTPSPAASTAGQILNAYGNPTPSAAASGAPGQGSGISAGGYGAPP